MCISLSSVFCGPSLCFWYIISVVFVVDLVNDRSQKDFGVGGVPLYHSRLPRTYSVLSLGFYRFGTRIYPDDH